MAGVVEAIYERQGQWIMRGIEQQSYENSPTKMDCSVVAYNTWPIISERVNSA